MFLKKKGKQKNNISNKNNTFPDIVQQVDKIISKYKLQLEQIKPKNIINSNNNYIPQDKKMIKLSDINNINNRESKEDFINNNYSKYNNKNNAVLTHEMENDNIKLGSALTLEKSKVVQLLNLLKIKDNEISNLKQQINTFEIKLNDLEKKYQDVINTMKQEQENKLNELYNKMNNENKKIQINFNENKKNSDILLGKYNNELNDNQKILKIFFDFFNKNIEVYKKTDILNGENLLIKSNDYSEEKAALAIDTWDKLINKLFQDNKDLYNELVRLKGEMSNYDIIMNQNTNYIQQENDSLKQLVEKLSFENKILKNNNNKVNQKQINNNYEHHHVIHSVCKHCNNDNRKGNKTSRDVSPIQKLRLKINHLENQIKNKSFV